MAYAYAPDPMGKKIVNKYKRISQGPSLGGRATVHIMTARYIYTAAVRYICFMDASACRQEIMDIFHFYAVSFGGVGTAARRH